jgi:hypothetical protein
VEGPLAVGLRPVHVVRAEDPRGCEAPPLVDGVRRIGDLIGVIDLLDREATPVG